MRHDRSSVSGKFLSQLINDIVKWGLDRQLVGPNAFATIDGQSKKMIEEAMELRTACFFAWWQESIADHEIPESIENEITDGIGDTLVTLILLCELTGRSLADCLDYAHEQIKDRKGRIEEGVFVKDDE